MSKKKQNQVKETKQEPYIQSAELIQVQKELTQYQILYSDLNKFGYPSIQLIEIPKETKDIQKFIIAHYIGTKTQFIDKINNILQEQGQQFVKFDELIKQYQTFESQCSEEIIGNQFNYQELCQLIGIPYSRYLDNIEHKITGFAIKIEHFQEAKPDYSIIVQIRNLIKKCLEKLQKLVQKKEQLEAIKSKAQETAFITNFRKTLEEYFKVRNTFILQEPNNQQLKRKKEKKQKQQQNIEEKNENNSNKQNDISLKENEVQQQPIKPIQEQQNENQQQSKKEKKIQKQQEKQQKELSKDNKQISNQKEKKKTKKEIDIENSLKGVKKIDFYFTTKQQKKEE